MPYLWGMVALIPSVHTIQPLKGYTHKRDHATSWSSSHVGQMLVD